MDAELSKLLAAAWQDLAAAVVDPEHGYHWPVLSTVDRAGRPRSRVVVLRAADGESWTLQCFTDRRSPKIREIENEPRVSWTFFDRVRNTQIRAEGRMRLTAHGPIVDAAWRRLQLWSRAAYVGDNAPSTPLATASIAPHVAGSEPDECDVEAGRASFVVCECDVHELDVLSLGARLQHRRARYWRDVAGDGTRGHCDSTWLQP